MLVPWTQAIEMRAFNVPNLNNAYGLDESMQPLNSQYFGFLKPILSTKQK